MLNSAIRIETTRCLLRRFTREDIPFVFSARHPGFCDGLKWSPPATEAELLEPHERSESAWTAGTAYVFTIEHKERRVPLGRIVIRRQTDPLWDLGFWTHPEHQGQGYMTETARAMLAFGFETLKATRIEADHATWNQASRKVLKKIGMRFEKTVPQGFEKAGQWVSTDLWALTVEEWSAK